MYTIQQMVEFAKQAGFSGSSADTIAAIAMAESSGNPYAINYADPGGSYGLTQINGAAHGPTATATLGNPLEAFRQAFRISKGGSNFTPWSTFNDGKYLRHAAGLNVVSGSTSGPTTTATAGSSAGAGNQPAGGLSGQSATGQLTTAGSPLSAIFGSVANLFQNAGVLILGVVLVAIGAWYIAKPNEAA